MNPSPSPSPSPNPSPTAAEAHPDFVLTRLLAAPRELVFKVWTEAEHLRRWMGPKGMTMPTCAMDFRVGGRFHYSLRGPDGLEMWGLWQYREIVAPERIVLLNSFSDAAGGLGRHPMAPEWPRYTISTTTFEDRGAQTLMTLRWNAWEATEAEQRLFDGAHASMQQGWAGTMEQLDAYLAQQAGATA